MTPVAKTGLHCGGIWGGTSEKQRKVTPVAKTGLHCGDSAVDGTGTSGAA